MSEIGELLLTALLNQGTSLLALTLFLAALGLPLPASMLLMAAGAFTRQGLMPLQEAVWMAWAAAVAGDLCSYLLGRFAGRWMPARLLQSTVWRQASALFARWGGWGVFSTRFLFTPMALPVNLLAGSSGFPLPRFMAAVLVGELTWVLLFGGLGHLFADQWEALSQLASDAAGALLGLLLLAGGAYAFWRSRTNS